MLEKEQRVAVVMLADIHQTPVDSTDVCGVVRVHCLLLLPLCVCFFLFVCMFGPCFVMLLVSFTSLRKGGLVSLL